MVRPGCDSAGDRHGSGAELAKPATNFSQNSLHRDGGTANPTGSVARTKRTKGRHPMIRIGGSDYLWLAPVRNLTWVAAHFGYR
jgi:hypothetical protein